jgi:hypothetical protein
MDLYFSTENKTGLNEVQKITVPVTDVNNLEDCQETEDDCEMDKIYYFIFGECIRLIYRVIDYVIFLCSNRLFFKLTL